MSIKAALQEDMKSSMRAKDQQRLTTIRMILAGIKQKEIDSQTNLSDSDMLALLSKMAKQRREAIDQYSKAGRDDLAEKEKQEITIIEHYLPKPLSEDEVKAIIEAAIKECGASSMQDMGKVMGQIKSKLTGQADMGLVSRIVKSLLT